MEQCLVKHRDKFTLTRTVKVNAVIIKGYSYLWVLGALSLGGKAAGA